jgi:hypothetical protein
MQSGQEATSTVDLEVEEVAHTRRLSDKILAVFHLACEQGALDIAGDLLHSAEAAMRRRSPAGGDQRRSTESLIAAHERLWLLRHPGDRPWVDQPMEATPNRGVWASATAST